jgi:hypothetical protein
MSNVKVGDWVVNVSDKDWDLTIGKRYKIIDLGSTNGKYSIIDYKGNNYFLCPDYCKLAPQKYRNPPREEYRELCEAWLGGADLEVANDVSWLNKDIFSDNYGYRINPASILPQPDERKERIKQQLLKIDADKLAQLIIDSGIEL